VFVQRFENTDTRTMSHKSIDVMLNQHPSEPRLVGEDFGLGSRLPVYPSSYPYDNIVSRNTDNRGQETDMDRNADRRRKSDTLSYIHPKESIQHNGHNVSHMCDVSNEFNVQNGHVVRSRQQYRVDDRNSDHTQQTTELSKNDPDVDLNGDNSTYDEIDTFYRGTFTAHPSHFYDIAPQRERPPVAQFEPEYPASTYSSSDTVSRHVLSLWYDYI